MTRVAWIAAIGLVSLAAAGAAAQPGGRPPHGEPPAEPADERAALRSRLERRLAEIDRLHDRVQEAMDRLDRGEPLDAVRGEVFPPGDLRRGDRGPDRREPGGRPPRGPEGGPPPPLAGPPDPDADRHLVISFLEEHDPAGAKRMEDVLRDRPEDGARWIGRTAQRIRAILEERDDTLRALRLREYLVGRRAVSATRRLADAMASPGNAADAEAARQDLNRALGEQFDVRMELCQREIKVLEDRVALLRTGLEQQQGKRDQFITDRADEIRRATREWAERARAGTPPKH